MIPEVAGAVVAGAGAFRRDDRAAHRAVVLHVAVDVVRHLVVNGHVVHLPDRQLDALGAPSVLRRQRDASIVRDREAIGVLGIPPDVVIVAAPVDAAEQLASIDRLEERAVGNQDLVLVGRRDREVNVVPGAADQLARPVHDAPGCAAIVGAPDRSLILGLDERVHAIRIGRRDGDVDLPQRRTRQPFDSPLILSLWKDAPLAQDRPFDSPLILSLWKDAPLAQDRPFDSPLILSLWKDAPLAQDRPFDSPLILSLWKDAPLAQDRPFDSPLIPSLWKDAPLAQDRPFDSPL